MDNIRAVVKDPVSYLRAEKEKNGRTLIGFVCSCAPEEIIHAAGALPVRVFGSDQGSHGANLHLQSYGCSLVRGILDAALSGRLDVLDGMVFPHTCDTIQRLSDIWRINLPKTFLADVVMPVKLTSPAARVYLIDVLKRFKRDIEAALDLTVTEDALRQSMALYHAIRKNLMSLDDLRRRHPGRMPGGDYHAMVVASMIMDRGAYLEILKSVVADFESAQDVPTSGRAPKLVLSGGVCSPPDIYGAIEEAGGVVVADDLCTGARYYETRADENLDPLEAMALRLLSRPVCPAKHAGLTKRADELIVRVLQSDAQGVVFVILKFCDPHAFDYPYLKERLDRENIPSLLLEMESNTQAGGQLQTRLETFIQILK